MSNCQTDTLPPLPTDLTIFTTEYTEKIRAYAREAVRLAARASVPAGWKLETGTGGFGEKGDQWVCVRNLESQLGQDFYEGRDRFMFYFLSALAAATTPPDEASDAMDAARYRCLLENPDVPASDNCPAHYLAVARVAMDGTHFIGAVADLSAELDAAIARTQGDRA